MRGTRWVVTVSVGIAFVSCGQGVGREAKTTLVNAVERTLGASSLRIETVATYEGEDHEAEVEYLAPDRVRLVLPSSEESIFIGKDQYFSEPDEPDRFLQVESPCVVTLDMAVPALAAVRDAADVRRVGGAFIFSTSGEAAIGGEARIDDGYLVSLVLRYELPDLNQAVEERHTLSHFGDDVSIEPPPSSQVSPAPGPGEFPGVIVIDQGSPPPCP
jgi:hypothetical protein